MGLNTTYVHGVRTCSIFFAGGYSPSSTDADIYLLGEDINGTYDPLHVSVDGYPIPVSNSYTLSDITVGKKAVGGTLTTTVMNALPFYYTFGPCSTSSGVHVFKPNAVPSFMHHAEARGGATDILRDDWGCKVAAGVFRWTDQVEDTPFLCSALDVMGCYERNGGSASKPAKQLAARPGHVPGTYENVFDKCTNATWNSGAVSPTFFQFSWATNIGPPVYTNGGCSGNEEKSDWAMALRQSLYGGPGIIQYQYFCDANTVHYALQASSLNKKTLSVKFEMSATASRYVQFDCGLAVWQNAKMSEQVAGEGNAFVVAAAICASVTVTVKDGVAASTYYGGT